VSVWVVYNKRALLCFILQSGLFEEVPKLCVMMSGTFWVTLLLFFNKKIIIN
jgi:hypothetical protein